MQSIPTQQDIAHRLGISAMTVSRALRGTSRVSAKTKQRVEAAAREMGFRPNPLVRAHMVNVRQQSKTFKANLAWMTANSAPENNAELKLVQEGARARAESIGFGLDIIRYDPSSMKAGTIKRMLHARGIYGFIVAPLPFAGMQIDLPWDDFACAAVGRSLRSPLLHYAMHHDYHGMETLIKRLVDYGHQRIALFYLMQWDARTDNAPLMVFDYYRRYRTNAQLLEPQFYADWKPADFRRWIDRAQPDAVIADYVQVATLFQAVGVDIPQSVGFATLSWRQAMPHFSGIRKRFELMGASCVDLVVAQLNRNERGIPECPKGVLIEGEWCEGSTMRTVGVRSTTRPHDLD